MPGSGNGRSEIGKFRVNLGIMGKLASLKNSFLEAQDRKTQQLVHELWKIDKDITKKYVGNMLTRIHGGVPAFKLPYGSLMLQKYLE